MSSSLTKWIFDALIQREDNDVVYVKKGCIFFFPPNWSSNETALVITLVPKQPISYASGAPRAGGTGKVLIFVKCKGEILKVEQVRVLYGFSPLRKNFY